MTKKSILLILATVAFVPFTLKAQVQFIAGVGGAFSFVKAQNLNTDFLPIVRPNVSLTTYIPLASRLGAQLGIGFSPKGYNTNQTQQFGDNKGVFTTKSRLNYISLPLLLSYNFYKTETGKLWIDGGMNYDLFIFGHTSYQYNKYEHDELVSSMGYTNKVKGVFTPSKYGATTKTYDVTGLDVAIKLQLRYQWNKRYSAAIYYQKSLYDLRVNTGDDATTVLKARSAGITLGYTL